MLQNTMPQRYLQQFKTRKSTWLIGALLVFFVVVLWTASPVQANQSYDCWKTTLSENNSSRAIWLVQTNGIYDGQALEASFLHLRNYCTQKPWGAESSYLFDHLIDIGFRKLDATEDDSLRYGLAADKKGEEWTKAVATYTDGAKNITPEEIISGFTANRQDNPTMTFQIDAWCNASGYQNLNLYKRYLATCEMARCIAQKTTIKIWESPTETSAQLVQQNLCPTIAMNRRNTELAFIRQLTARAALRTTKNLFTSYADTYFKTRRSQLYDEITNFDQWLTFVNHKLQEWTPICSH